MSAGIKSAGKKTFEILTKNGRVFKLLFDNAKDAILWANGETGIIINCNKTAERLFEKTKSEIIGAHQTSLHPGPMKRYYAKRFKSHLKDRKPVDTEAEIITKSGKIKSVRITSTVTFIGGKPIIQGIFHDITERKAREEKVRESEEKYRMLFHSSPISLWEEDFSKVKIYIDALRSRGVKNIGLYFKKHPEGLVKCASLVKVIDVNKATLKMYKAKGLAEFKKGLGVVFGRQSYETFKKEILAIAAGKKIFESDAVTKTLKGARKYVSLKWSVPPGYEETLSRVLVSVVDLTEHRRADERERQLIRAEATAAIERKKALEIEKAYNELRTAQMMLVKAEKLTVLGTLGRDVAHKLNSPLAGVLSLVRTYMKEKDPGSEEYADLREMEEACVHMAEIIKELSAFSYQSKDRFVRLNVNDVLKSTLMFGSHLLESRGIKIVKDYARNLPPIRGNKSQIQQVILNMVTNARDAMPNKGVFKIGTRSVLSNGRRFVEMKFADTGRGISKENLQNIFKPFFTTKGPERGVGLGLAIVHAIVKAHGGDISVKSTPDKGTTFRIILPV